MRPGAAQIFAGRRRLDHLEPFGPPVRPACAEDIESLLAFTKELLPLSNVNIETALSIHERNSESFLIVDGPEGPIGLAALLLLNYGGLDALLAGDFCFDRPELGQLTSTGEAPAAIYVWALCMKGRAVASLSAIMAWAKQDGRENAHLYSRPTTTKGERFMRHGGFHPIACGQPDLWRYERPVSNEASIAA